MTPLLIPIVGTLAEKVLDRLIASPQTTVTRAEAPVVRREVQEAVKEAITTDPVLVNELNGEKPIQSRVLWGNGIAAAGTIVSGLIPVLQLFGVITEEEGTAVIQGFGAVVALGGVAYSAYGRLATGLRPLFSRKTAGR